MTNPTPKPAPVVAVDKPTPKPVMTNPTPKPAPVVGTSTPKPTPVVVAPASVPVANGAGFFEKKRSTTKLASRTGPNAAAGALGKLFYKGGMIKKGKY
jgi:hypothetical protein